MDIERYGVMPKPKEFGELVVKYFDTTDMKEWNPASLCLFLGITRKQYRDLMNDEKYMKYLDYAQAQIEKKYLEDLNNAKCTGAIFALKNIFDYADRKDIKATLEGQITIEQMLQGSKINA